MADTAWIPHLAAPARTHSSAPRHSAVVRFTHGITALCFFALLITGIEIVISHPRFYWGETGNVLTPSLFDLPIPASRGAVKTGYGFVLKDQNGWSRALHFQAGWIAIAVGLLYTISGLWTGHLRRQLLPTPASLSWPELSKAIADHLRLRPPGEAEAWSYNVLQRLAYLAVIFVMFPLMIWTGLAMSPAITGAFPAIVTVWGGHQSARTIHFFVTLSLVVFLLVHIGMICVAGFWKRTRPMIAGRAATGGEQR